MKSKSSINNSSLSREDIQQYQSTKDEKVKHAIEEKSLANEFDMDALDGWADSKLGIEVLTTSDKKYFSSKKWIVVSLIATLSIFIFTISYFNQKSTSILENKGNNRQIVHVEQTDITTPHQIEKMIEIPIHKQIQPHTIRKDFEQKENLEQKQSNIKPTDFDLEEKLPIHEIAKTEIQKEIANKQFFAKEIYLHDLKLVDYRVYRSKPIITTKQMIISGTPANKESENSTNEEVNDWKSIDIPYIEYIDKTILIFGKGNYKKALTRLEIILKTYPEDINANFYAGLCYYNLKESSKAITSFQNCLKNEFTNFNEEAEWYLAKSYLQSGNTDKATEIQDRIKKNGGYYSQF